MCLIAFAWSAHPRYRLVVAANRDEFHQRPTRPLHEWSDAPGVYGGLDLREGGGWLALSSAGRLAAVTNYREPHIHPRPRSRGALVRAFAAGADPAEQHAGQLAAEANEYGPFNLLLWDGRELVHCANRPQVLCEPVAPGIHGLSNGRLDAPWPKVRQLTGALRHWLEGADTAEPDVAGLFAALADERGAADPELPDTGVGLETERRLAPAFIRGQAYGTRASSVILVGTDGRARFIERNFGPAGARDGERSIELRWQAG